MSDPFTAAIGIGSQVVGSVLQSRSARRASGAQVDAAQQGIDEQARQFDEVRRLLQPYVDAGPEALRAMQTQIGMEGAGPQQEAIERIASGPLLQQLTRQGEQAILQTASATGGLRGGNLQGALAQFRPAMLQAALDQQYSRLGGLTTLGQNAAAGVGAAGMQTGVNTANLLTQQGAAAAGGIIGGAAPFVNLTNIPAQYMGFARGAGLPSVGGLFGGRAAAPAASGWTSGYDLPMGR